MAESGPLDVECDGDVIRLLFAQQPHQHRREAVNGVGRESPGVRQFPDRIEGPEHIIAAVNQEKSGFSCFVAQFSSFFNGDEPVKVNFPLFITPTLTIPRQG